MLARPRDAVHHASACGSAGTESQAELISIPGSSDRTEPGTAGEPGSGGKHSRVRLSLVAPLKSADDPSQPSGGVANDSITTK